MRKIRLIMAIVLLFAIENVSAQDYVSREVEVGFSQNDAPDVIDNILYADNSYNAKDLEKDVRTAKIFKFNKERALDLIKQDMPILSLGLYTDTGEYIIADMVSASEIFATSTVITSRGEAFSVNEIAPAVYYRGVLRGNEKTSLVSIKISDKEISGFISTSEGNLVIGKLKDSDSHIIYNDINLLKKFDFDCATPEGKFEPKNDFTVKSLPLLSKCVHLHYTTEYDMLQQLSTINNVVDFVTNLHNQVSTLYYNEGIPTPLSSVSVWTAEDPFTATINGGLLGQYQSNVSSFNGDLSQLLTFRSVGGGVAAGLNGICNSNVDSSLSASGIYYWQDIRIPQYSWNVNVITHEFGHLMGSDHTHACVWNGNGTAIDGCGYQAGYGGCDGPIPGSGGTIMSYCHLNYSINFYNGFGPQPGNKIRSKVNAGTCLEVCNGCIPQLTIFTPVTTSQTFAVSNTLTAQSSINNNLNVTYQGNAVVLKSGFNVSGNTTGKFRAVASSCSLVSVKSSNFEQTNDVSQKALTSGVILSPNPALDKVNVISVKSIRNITVTSLDGTTVFNAPVDGKTFSFELNIDRYYKGLYLVTIIDSDGEAITQKLIKE